MAFSTEVPGRLSTPDTLFAFGLNHKQASVEVRERLYVSDDELPQLLALLRKELDECVVLSTCNRTEVYCVTSERIVDIDHFKQILIDFKHAGDVVSANDFFSLTSCGSTQQIFNIAASIDSQVLGDSQILKQLRHAYCVAQENGATGKILHQVLQRACKLGKAIYRDTSLHFGAVSISVAAVELALQKLGSLRDRTVIVIGAGEMACTTAAAIARRRVSRLVVVNRTPERAESLRRQLVDESGVTCEILGLEDLTDVLPEADLIVSATAADGVILTKGDLAGTKREQMIVDIAVPRDIDPSAAELENITLCNIDELRTIIDHHHERRSKDLPRVKKMIVNEMVDFLTWYYAQPLLPSILKKGQKPSGEEAREIVRVKSFLNDNLAFIHKLAARADGDFNIEIEGHFQLIEKLQELKAHKFAAAAA